EVAFAACNSLTSINVDTDNPAYKSVDGVLYTKDGKTLIQYPRKKSGESYNIPADVTQIGKQAFWFCRDLIAVTVPAGVTAIGFSAFSGCDKLASVNVDAGNPVYKSQGGVLYSKDGKTLICYPGGRDDKSFTVPAEVTSIYQSAFYDCENLTAVTIHDNVSYIGADAFTRCSSLVIYAECMFQPMSWAEGWNYSERPVVWGYGTEIE
ncbi:MAG: leucine-rich repeat domain-containing protein, partial [Clostridia bacterium]|nr:leucine-rich repeat domain-containing protein [Clostridia bacterium]